MVLPITMWGFLANTNDWDIISIPPTMTAVTEMRQSLGTTESHPHHCKPVNL